MALIIYVSSGYPLSVPPLPPNFFVTSELYALFLLSFFFLSPLTLPPLCSLKNVCLLHLVLLIVFLTYIIRSVL
jgi:hypothetical protein